MFHIGWPIKEKKELKKIESSKIKVEEQNKVPILRKDILELNSKIPEKKKFKQKYKSWWWRVETMGFQINT